MNKILKSKYSYNVLLIGVMAAIGIVMSISVGSPYRKAK